ncbi:lambda phage CII family protein [Serratia entomophila]|uniref:lambda phage CII family protein n=1 Tax=Serratia entomophila TaxID=42906 RepID=UPI00217A09D6|nr:lambda phage CII family protein [Serratia entomophila]CAI2001919.1 Bacteriophage CII protein [Serratia entomophila]
METAKTRNDARRIESTLLNKIAMKGVSSIAAAVGVNPSQVTRWKESLVPRMAMLLAVLEWGVADDEMAELAKRLAGYLSNEKAEQCANTFSA